MKHISTLVVGYCIAFTSFAQVTFQDNAPCTTGSPSSGNSFDWRTQTYTLYTNAQGIKTVESPFYNSSLTNPNVNEFSQYTLKDYEPADGWELIQYDFGTSTVGTDAPYLILYNRHTGLMRVFVSFANLLGQNNAITISLRYVANESRSATMEFYSPSGLNATENFNNEVPAISQNNFYVNQTLFWYHADFYLHYDPCVCNYETSLEFLVKLTSSSNLQFTLQGQAIQNLNPPYATDAYGRTGSIGNLTDHMGMMAVKNLEKGASWADDILTNGFPFWGIPPAKESKLAALFGSISGPLGSAIKGMDWLVSLFEEGATAQPPRPLAFDIRLEGNGSITSTSTYMYKELIVPGSEQTLISTTVRPFYNKAPGLFTLLKVPTVLTNTDQSYIDEWTPERHETWIYSAFKLKENISYTVNPHANIDLAQSEVLASLIFEPGLGTDREETELYGLGCMTTIVKPFSYYRYIDEYSDYELGWTPGQVKLQIVAKFKVAGSSLVIPYVGVFNTKLEYDYNLYPWSAEVLPTTGCSTTVAEATSTQIKAVCNGTLYKGLVDEFARPDENTPVDQALYQDEIRIFPNPVQNSVNFDLSKISGNQRMLSLTIYDLNGKLLRTEKVQAGKVNTIETNFLSKGVYIAKITGDNFNKTAKIVKQ